jgi:hypothetical protein
VNVPPLLFGAWLAVICALAWKALGWHRHRCSKCGHRWAHSDLRVGSVEHHTCARCGHIEWWVES